MSDRFRRLDDLVAKETNEEVKDLLLELRQRWEAENQEIEIMHDKTANEDFSFCRHCDDCTGPGD